MATKPEAKMLNIREQIIEDRVTGLTFQLVAVEGSDAPARLRIFGGGLAGTREILFNSKGDEAGAGTALTSARSPSWLRVAG